MIEIKLSYFADESTIKALIDITISLSNGYDKLMKEGFELWTALFKIIDEGEHNHKAMLLPNVTKLLPKLV